MESNSDLHQCFFVLLTRHQ
ncbi:MAG: hypothetical protein EGP06_00240 [SAR202 cluster bacterium]|nr:MAG: hypothetical protein EGP09_06875 [SAR202 cluster bacterium]KAA1300273.1 MAG: hypothetical protein EGP06_00240 [SAR202 cluster bacterium]